MVEMERSVPDEEKVFESEESIELKREIKENISHSSILEQARQIVHDVSNNTVTLASLDEIVYEQDALRREEQDTEILHATLGVAGLITFAVMLYSFFLKREEKARRKEKLRLQSIYQPSGKSQREKDYFHINPESDSCYHRLH